MGADDGSRGWGPELRVEVRRGGGVGGRSGWLRNGAQGEWKSPTATMNAATNCACNRCMNNGELMGDVSTLGEKGKESGQTSILKSTKSGSINVELKDFFFF